VAIADEEAMIAFDPATGREDFIRRASFRTKEQDFGFLVPTPTKPELGEVDDAVFERLAKQIEPRVIEKVRYVPELTATCMFFSRAASKSAAPTAIAAATVQVLDEQRVGGFDAAVLRSDDEGALAKWLADHGYDERPELAAWLAPYVAKRWIVTAFKIAKAKDPSRVDLMVDPGAVATKAVRMTFTTDKPMFPYREPADQRATSAALASRMLRVFVVTPGRAAGALGNGDAWPGRAVWANTPSEALLGSLGVKTAPGVWLTAFEDRSSPRPGVDDLFFTPSKDTTPIEPPPIEHIDERPIPIPVDLIAGGALIAWLLARRRKPSPP
jgi:hypothetical protein